MGEVRKLPSRLCSLSYSLTLDKGILYRKNLLWQLSQSGKQRDSCYSSVNVCRRVSIVNRHILQRQNFCVIELNSLACSDHWFTQPGQFFALLWVVKASWNVADRPVWWDRANKKSLLLQHLWSLYLSINRTLSRQRFSKRQDLASHLLSTIWPPHPFQRTIR